MDKKRQHLDLILEGLLTRYRERVPQVKRILEAMIKKKLIQRYQDIQNDHIAFRTMGVPYLGIPSLSRIFLHYGYQKMDFYHFPEKKIDAYWFSPPSPDLPRVFISELRVKDLSVEAQKIITSYTQEVKKNPIQNLNLDDPKAVDIYLHQPLWKTPTYSDYKTLLVESEYASWVIYNRYYLNHYTISVHALPPDYNTLDKFNAFLEGIGIILNRSGGKIKVSSDGLLLQSSSVSHMIEAEFSDKEKHSIAGSYVEFAERKILSEFQHLPMEQITTKHRREGFEVNNADKIFESTYTSQTGLNDQM